VKLLLDENLSRRLVPMLQAVYPGSSQVDLLSLSGSDDHVIWAYAREHDCQRAGRPVDMRDTQIAGIALARHAAVATRNVRHFGDLEVPVINPWAGV
jgi:Domain of unknown function (DUF5615)